MDAVTPRDHPAPKEADFRIALIGLLSRQHMQLAECLYRNLDDTDIAAAIGIPRTSIQVTLENLYAALRFDSKIPMYERRGYVGELYAAYVAGKDADKPVDDAPPPDSPEKATARARITQLGIEIDTLVNKISDLAPKQREAIACLAAKVHDDETIASRITLSKTTVEHMFRLMDQAFEVPEELEVTERRLYVKAIVLWATDEYAASADLFESLKKPADDSPPKQALLPEGEMEKVVDRLAVATPTNLKVARCLAENIDIGTTLTISPASVPGYISDVYKRLKLPREMGSERRRAIIVEAYRRLEKLPAVEAPKAPKVEKASLPVLAGIVVTVPDMGSVVDITDDEVGPKEDVSAVIAARKLEGYELAGYVINPATDKRYLLFIKRSE